SVMPTSMGTMNSPNRGRSAGFFNNKPTMPHISEHLQITLRLPVAHMTRILDPFHALQTQEFGGQILADAGLDHLVGGERIARLVQRLRQQTDSLVADLLLTPLIQVHI